MLIQDADFDPSEEDASAHSSWLHVRMFFFFFCMFSKEKAEIILTMRGSLLGQQFLFHRERVGWHCVKLHKLPLQLWSHFHNELQIAPSWLQLVIAHEALQNSSFKDQSGDLEKWSLSTHHRQCYTPVHRTN